MAEGNTGHRNTGHRNTGHRNTGHWNTGHRNTGDWNTGDQNTGHRNTGDWNTGDWNTGDWNTGDQNTGFFCTETPAPTFFDKPTTLTWDKARGLIPWVDLPVGCEWVPADKMTTDEKASNPSHATTGGFLRVRHKKIQDAFPVVWAGMAGDLAWKRRWTALPNFDADKFLACTGVDVRLDPDLNPRPAASPAAPVVADTIVIGGKTFKLIPAEE